VAIATRIKPNRPASDEPSVTCRRPGCGNPVPPSAGRGRPRVFCGDSCARQYHNGTRPVTQAAAEANGDGTDPLAELDALVRQAAVCVRTARAQAAETDPARVRADVAEAEVAQRRAEAATVTAVARQAEAEAEVRALAEALEASRTATREAEETKRQATEQAQAVTAELSRVRAETANQLRAVHADIASDAAGHREESVRILAERDAALAAVQDVRAAAEDEIGRARREATEARAEIDRIRADVERERNLLREHLQAQVEAARALTEAERARAERAEAQLDAERADRRQLTARLSGPGTEAADGINEAERAAV
jgi:chromosome segregation ATPase